MGVAWRGDLREFNILVLIVRVGRDLKVRIIVGGSELVTEHREEHDYSYLSK